MCDLCLSFPCLTGCPNGEEFAEDVCTDCGDVIEEGEAYTVIADEIYCMGCIEQKTTRELLALCGVEVYR